MLELCLLNARVGRRFEIRKGVEWQFCELSRCFEDDSLKASFENGVFMVTNEWINFRAFDDRNTIYEVKLSAVEEGKIKFWIPDKKSLFHYDPLKNFEKENREIDMSAFIKSRNPSEKITICENVEEKFVRNPYTETLVMEIDRSSNILRFYVTVTYQSQYVKKMRGSSFLKETDSRLKTMTLDEEVAFDFNDDSFMEVMKKITNYCERKNVKLSIGCSDFMIPGHSIYIPNTVVTSENFEIIFDFENVRVVYVAKNIMDDTYYTDTLGGEYNVGFIVQETKKRTKEHAFIREYGASNVWKMVYPEDSEYIFGCGFSL